MNYPFIACGEELHKLLDKTFTNSRPVCNGLEHVGSSFREADLIFFPASKVVN